MQPYGCACSFRERFDLSTLSGKSPFTCVTPVHVTCRPSLQLSRPGQGSASTHMVCLRGSAPVHKRAKPSQTAQPTGKPCTPHAVSSRPTGAPVRKTHCTALPAAHCVWMSLKSAHGCQQCLFHDLQVMKVKCTALCGLRSACKGRCRLAPPTLHVLTWCWCR